MAEYASNTTWSEIARRIRDAERIALIPHSKPDGDALGSALAIKRALEPQGKTLDLFIAGPLEAPLEEIIGETPWRRAEDNPPGNDYDVILVLDTGARSQLKPLTDWLDRHREIVIGVDHHSRGEDVAWLRIVEPSASATAQLVVDLLDELGCEITGGIGGVAEPLYVGLATDTGWFRYENAQAPAFHVAARLIEAGVNKSRLYQIIEETHPIGRLELESRALASLELARNGEIAIQSLRLEDFQESGCGVEHLTGVVNLPMIVRQVRVSILLAETERGRTKMSFRAKPPLNGSSFTDVNELAQRFDGGGHRHAAGARLEVGLDEAKRALLEELAQMEPTG
jgi:phosphoesterase RecJ-like protein